MASIEPAIRQARAAGASEVDIGLWLASAVKGDGVDEPKPGSLSDVIYDWWIRATIAQMKSENRL